MQVSFGFHRSRDRSARVCARRQQHSSGCVPSRRRGRGGAVRCAALGRAEVNSVEASSFFPAPSSAGPHREDIWHLCSSTFEVPLLGVNDLQAPAGPTTISGPHIPSSLQTWETSPARMAMDPQGPMATVSTRHLLVQSVMDLLSCPKVLILPRLSLLPRLPFHLRLQFPASHQA